MGFWIFMLAMDLLIPVVMIVLGRIYEKRPPKEINTTSGYRTAMSMKNGETWKFAHNYFGKLCRICGLILLPLSVVAMLFGVGREILYVSVIGGIVCAVQIVVFTGLLIPTERALKRCFDPSGNRR